MRGDTSIYVTSDILVSFLDGAFKRLFLYKRTTVPKTQRNNAAMNDFLYSCVVIFLELVIAFVIRGDMFDMFR